MNSLIIAILISAICLSFSTASPLDKKDAAQTSPDTTEKPSLLQRLEQHSQSGDEKSNQIFKTIHDDFKQRQEEFEKVMKAQDDAFEQLFAPIHHKSGKRHKRSLQNDSNNSSASESESEEASSGWFFW